MKSIGIGIIGAGTVGRGVIEILRDQREVLRNRVGVDFVVRAVYDRSPEKPHKAELFKASELQLSPSAAALIENPAVDVVLELIGGLDPADEYIRAALRAGKSVITANKALLARRGAEIFGLAREKGVDIGFEASVAGALPVIKTMRRELAPNNVRALYGILNGTCNFIITRMQEDNMDYADALKLAQDKGFAEADPAFDVGGNDAAQKLVLLAGLAFDARLTEQDVPAEGITEIRRVDLELARSMGWVIRLLAVARREADNSLFLRVHPAMVPEGHVLAHVTEEKNAVFFDTDYSGPALIMGNGAGAYPTAAAVVSDLIAGARRVSPENWYASAREIPATKSFAYRYYLRFQTVDRPGVLAEIARVLADRDISIATVHQYEGAEPVNVVVTTHLAREAAMLDALDRINQLPIILQKTVYIRIEDRV